MPAGGRDRKTCRTRVLDNQLERYSSQVRQIRRDGRSFRGRNSRRDHLRPGRDRRGSLNESGETSGRPGRRKPFKSGRIYVPCFRGRFSTGNAPQVWADAVGASPRYRVTRRTPAEASWRRNRCGRQPRRACCGDLRLRAEESYKSRRDNNLTHRFLHFPSIEKAIRTFPSAFRISRPAVEPDRPA